MDESQTLAVEAYQQTTGREYTPGDVVELPVESLIFAEYQNPWTDLSCYKRARCLFDEETNDWLVGLVTHVFLRKNVPPIYVDILPDGIALVDGAHRTTAALIAGRSIIRAHLNKTD